LDHRRICGPSLTETSLCGAYLYLFTTRASKFYGKGLHTLLRAGSRAAHGKLSVIPNRRTQKALIQGGGTRAGDSCVPYSMGADAGG